MRNDAGASQPGSTPEAQQTYPCRNSISPNEQPRKRSANQVTPEGMRIGQRTGVDSAQDAAAAASHALDGEDGVADLEIDPNPIALALVFGQNEAGEHLNQEISPASPGRLGAVSQYRLEMSSRKQWPSHSSESQTRDVPTEGGYFGRLNGSTRSGRGPASPTRGSEVGRVCSACEDRVASSIGSREEPPPPGYPCAQRCDESLDISGSEGLQQGAALAAQLVRDEAGSAGPLGIVQREAVARCVIGNEESPDGADQNAVIEDGGLAAERWMAAWGLPPSVRRAYRALGVLELYEWQEPPETRLSPRILPP
mgnify:CR=1 FL=1|jgi:hypothetical protein